MTQAITVDPEVLGGTPVFLHTRVPVQALFDYLKPGESIDEFLENFPTVSKEQVLDVLAEVAAVLSHEKYIYESIAG